MADLVFDWSTAHRAGENIAVHADAPDGRRAIILVNRIALTELPGGQPEIDEAHQAQANATLIERLANGKWGKADVSTVAVPARGVPPHRIVIGEADLFED